MLRRAPCPAACGSVRRQEAVLPHQASHPAGRAADAGKAQTGPDFAIALAGEAALGDGLLDVLQQSGVVAGSPPGACLGTTSAGRWRYTVARETFQQRATRTRPYTLFTEAETPGSSPRPPACQRGAGLQAGNLLPQQLGLHGHLADLTLQPRDLVVAVVAGALPSAPPPRPTEPDPVIATAAPP